MNLGFLESYFCQCISLPICIFFNWIIFHISRNTYPKLIVFIKEGVPFLPSWFSGKFHRSTIVFTKKSVPTQTWQNDMEQKTNKTSETPVSHWWSDLTRWICDSDAPMEHPPLADRTSFFHISLLDKTWKSDVCFKKSTKTVHKELTQNVDSSSFSGLWWVFWNHNSTRFSGNSIVDSHSPTAFDFRSGRGFRCVLVEFWCPLALNQNMAWNMATPSIT